MKRRPGLLLLIALLLLPAGIRYGRVALFAEERHPAFSVTGSEMIWVELGAGFPHPGVHQFIDGTTVGSVIEMTHLEKGSVCSAAKLLNSPLKSGEFLSLKAEDIEITTINRNWMAAEKRMVLNIPLLPETMAADDWLALPGVGPKLAARIEADRQKNGEFSSFRQLKRVPGIGSQRLVAWEPFFSAAFNDRK